MEPALTGRFHEPSNQANVRGKMADKSVLAKIIDQHGRINRSGNKTVVTDLAVAD